jgi:predicted phosphodiesterase
MINEVREELMTNGFIKVDEFCERYNVSKKYLSADISDFKKELATKMNDRFIELISGKNYKDGISRYVISKKGAEEIKLILQKFKFNNNDNLSIVNFFFDEDTTRVMPFGDWHIHSKESIKEIRAILELCRKEKVYIFALGDLIENSLKNSVGDVHAQELQPNEQYNAVRNILNDYRDIILAVFEGNHEERTRKVSGLNPVEKICKELDMLYIPSKTFGFFKNNTSFKEYHSSHCTTNGILLDTKRKGIYTRASETHRADLYFAGHSHSSVYENNKVWVEVDYDKMKHIIRPYIALMNGCPLHYFHGYGAKKGYSYSPFRLYYVEINNNKMKIETLLEREEML